MTDKEDEDDECDCEYPHSSDFDPYNFEPCSCKDNCWHFPDSLTREIAKELKS